MRVIDIDDVIYAMRSQTQFVLRCEEVFHDKISAAAGAILSAQPRKPYVCLTGPSGSGKTTTAMRLKAYLENLGVKVCLLSMDNFFLPLAERPKDLTDWESPLCVNRQLLLGTIEKLSNGETVQVPWYDFPNNRTGGYTPMEGSREAIIIAEGIHMLNPLLFDPIRDRATGIYVAPRTRIITPGARIIHPEQVRVARRMAAATPCVRPSSAPSPSTRASRNTSPPTNRTPPSTSIPSTTTSCASSPSTCGRSRSSPRISTTRSSPSTV